MKITPLIQPRQRNVHPGELLREEFLSPLGITPSRLAKEAKLPHRLVKEILNERRDVTPETDRHLCAYFKQTPGYWLRVQLAYDRRDASKLGNMLTSFFWENPRTTVKLAAQLHGASPLRARQLKDKIVAGFYGKSPLRLIDAFLFSDVDSKIIRAEGAVLRPFDTARVFRTAAGDHVLAANAAGQRERYYRVEPVTGGKWGFWGGVLVLSETHKASIQAGFQTHPGAGKKPRKRRLLPEFEKLMCGKPGDDVQAALDEDRGDDPDMDRKLTNTHELADFAEAELALSPSQETLPALVYKNFPDRRSAARWLKAPCSGLQGRIPARMAKTRKGRAEVKAFLIGVGSGNFT